MKLLIIVAVIATLEMLFGIDETGALLAFWLVLACGVAGWILTVVHAVNDMFDAMERDHEWY